MVLGIFPIGDFSLGKIPNSIYSIYVYIYPLKPVKGIHEEVVNEMLRSLENENERQEFVKTMPSVLNSVQTTYKYHPKQSSPAIITRLGIDATFKSSPDGFYQVFNMIIQLTLYCDSVSTF